MKPPTYSLAELCDPRNHHLDRNAFDLVAEADPAVTTKLLSRVREDQFHSTPYWKVCLMLMSRGRTCERCGGKLIGHVGAIPTLPLVHGTEHVNLDKFNVIHKNPFVCKAIQVNAA